MFPPATPQFTTQQPLQQPFNQLSGRSDTEDALAGGGGGGSVEVAQGLSVPAQVLVLPEKLQRETEV